MLELSEPRRGPMGKGKESPVRCTAREGISSGHLLDLGTILSRPMLHHEVNDVELDPAAAEGGQMLHMIGNP